MPAPLVGPAAGEHLPHHGGRTWYFLPAIAALACYAVVLTGGFIWDDFDLIVASPLVTEHSSLSSHFRHPFSTDGLVEAREFYRPLVTLSYALDHWLWGDWAGGYHLTNLLLHMIASLLVLAACRRSGAGVIVSAVLATGFAVSPRLSESVAWISGRTDVAACLGCLTAFLLYRDDARRWWRRVLACLALLGALLCKEVAVAGAVGIAIQACLDPAEPRSVRRLASDLVPLGVVITFYCILRYPHVLSVADEFVVMPRDWATVVVLAADAVARYAYMVVNPWQPRLQIGNSERPELAMAAIGAILLGCTLYWAWRLRARLTSAQWFAFGMGATAIASVSHVMRFHVNVIAADRFLYSPLAALAIGIAPLLDRAYQGHRRLSFLVSTVLLASLSVATTVRARTWANELTLWRQAVAESRPDEHLPRVELAMALMRRARYAEALAYLDQLPIDVKRVYAVNLATCLDKLGYRPDAIRTLRSVVREHPTSPRLRMNLMFLYARAQRFEEMRAAAAGLPEAFGTRPDIRAVLDRVLSATEELRAMPPAEPGEPPEMKERRAVAFDRLGALPEAQALWSSVALDPQASGELRIRAASYLVLFGDKTVAGNALNALAGLPQTPAELPALGTLLADRFEDG